MAEDAVGVDGSRRASGWLACGIVVGIAVLTASGIVGWARLGAGAATRPPAVPETLEEAVPAELAGGIELAEVPAAVAAAFDGPVVAARLLDEVPAGAGCDFLGQDFDGEPEVETVMVTPDFVHVSLLGRTSGLDPAGAEEGGLMRGTCSARWEDGRWWESGGGLMPANQPMAGPSGASCCDENGLGTAEATVMAPEDAQWAVQARGGYSLAYPIPDSRALPISWRFRARQGLGGPFGGGFDGMDMASATTVTFVDAAGEVVGEAILRS